MIVLSQKQTDPVITYSASSATNTSQMLSMASKSDQRGVNIEHKLDTIEHHLKQMVWLFSYSFQILKKRLSSHYL